MENDNIGFRLRVEDLERLIEPKINGIKKNNTLLDAVRILDILYFENELTREEIEKRLFEKYDDFIINSTIRRKLQNMLTMLCNRDVLQRPDEEPFIYCLKDDFNFTTTSYSKGNLEILNQWKSILESYDYIPAIDDLKRILARDLQDYNQNNESYAIVDLPSIDYKGKKHIEPFFIAINEQQLIDFKYQKYNGEKQLVKDFMPYILKEHNRRWYVVGKRKPSGDFLTYAIDRVLAVKFDGTKDTFDREKFNSKELFQYSMGIYTSWQKSDAKHDPNAAFKNAPVRISFKVKDGNKFDNISYLISNKIHASQKESKPDSEGWVTIKLNMFPETDLIREIRKIGIHCIKDVQPVFLRRWVEEL